MNAIDDNAPPVAAKYPLVLPGDPLQDDGNMGRGTFRRGDKLHAAVVGFENPSAGYSNVLPMGGPYQPRQGDKVIGIVVETGPSFWRLDINTALNTTLHHSETLWDVPFGSTSSFMKVGDACLAEVLMSDRGGTNQIGLKGEGCRKLYNGTIVRISPPRVPRIIGRGGNMVTLIRKGTGTRIQVGQNGFICVDGDPDGIVLAQRAIELTAHEAPSSGLTERVEAFLKEHKGD